MKSPPLVVLDTNVVLSALVYDSGASVRLRRGWQEGAFVPLASEATVRELVRVLGYPKFRLAPDEQAELLADYLPWVRVIAIPSKPPAVPDCRDPFDVAFLHLAVVGRAKAIVSGDRDLLSLKGGRGLPPVMGMAEFAAGLAG